jgi:hypothetical protein
VFGQLSEQDREKLKLSEQDREKLRELINRLLNVNFLVKELEREHYQNARKFRAQLEAFFKFLNWDFQLDERNECVCVFSREGAHRLRLSQDESIALLVLRLIYQEQRQGVLLTVFPLTTKYEIRAKYETFRLPFPGKTRFLETIKLFTQYKLLQPIDDEVNMDECRFRLFHTLLYALDADSVERIHERIQSYDLEIDEEELFNEMDETATAR